MAANRSSTSSNRTPRARKRKPEPAQAVEQELDLNTSEDNQDSDFGAGIVDDDSQASAARKPRTRRKTTTRKPKADAVEVQPSAAPEVVEDVPAPPSRSAFADDLDDVEFFGNDESSSRSERGSENRDFGDSGEEFVSEGSSEGGSDRPRQGDDYQDGPHKRRRRRKRNRRGGDMGDNRNQQQGYQQQGFQQHGSQNRHNNQQGRDRGGRHQRGGRPNQQQDRNRQGGGRRMTKFEQNAAPSGPAVTSGVIDGVLELHPKAYGFLRSATNDYGARDTDPFVSSSLVERYGLREGIMIRGEVGPGSRGQGPRLLSIESIDGRPPDDFQQLKHFDTLTAINPFEQIKLETGPHPVTMRVMDLLTPIGKGQRALIVAPPRSGKTMLLQDIANSVSHNHPEIHLIVLLIDERPEEVTEMRRMVRGEVIASSMDRDVESHVRISQLIFERGKRIAEAGKDVFILMDSVTRTARAFNKWVGGGRDSKTLSGGLDHRALEIPRKMFGTARRFDEGGSLTVCATALIDTGSRMDDAIFLEFKGTGNMELVLSRDLADRRIWPAIDITKSGTRREEKILPREVLEGVTMLRRSLVSMNPTEAMDQLIRTLGKFETNAEFLAKIRSVL